MIGTMDGFERAPAPDAPAFARSTMSEERGFHQPTVAEKPLEQVLDACDAAGFAGLGKADGWIESAAIFGEELVGALGKTTVGAYALVQSAIAAAQGDEEPEIEAPEITPYDPVREAQMATHLTPEQQRLADQVGALNLAELFTMHQCTQAEMLDVALDDVVHHGLNTTAMQREHQQMAVA